MNIYTYDFECFKHDWLIVLKSFSEGTYTKIHNDNDALMTFIDIHEPMLCGFNNKHYDSHLLRGILADFSPEEVHKINDYIIVDGQEGWNYPPLRDVKVPFVNQMDVMDDMQTGLSLKAIEGHLGMNIQETEVDFTLDRHLTDEEIERTFAYCTHDVDATEEILRLRMNYFQTKLDIGEMAGITAAKSLYCTNAKLTSLLLKAKAPETPWKDERCYKYPDNLRLEFIPDEVKEFFDRIGKMEIPDSDLWTSSLDIEVGGCPCTVAFGGIHGAIPTYIDEAKDHWIICNWDVASYYPHLMTNNGYTSRNLPDPKVFSDVLETRMKAKKAGDKKTANALKLIVNTTYGATLNGHNGIAYNDLYDPLMARSVCISGQLYLLELTCHLLQECKTMKVVQLNTDGLMVSMDNGDYPKAQEILDEWQKRTGFDLEEDKIKKIIQKDVNNYIEIATDGSIKKKGGYLVRGLSQAGAFNVNNNNICVANAILDYFTKGVPPEVSIVNDNDLSHFQMIAKGGSKYKGVYTVLNGDNHYWVQNCNRVYASKDKSRGTLYKVKRDDDSVAKIAGLPEHCLIDNANVCTIDDVDKQWYIDLANKQINDFLGVKPEKPKKERKKMATKTPMNVYQKLAEARQIILESGMKKTGKNPHLQFMYFELEDIVPTVTKVFREMGLLSVVNYNSEQAVMTIINTDNPTECVLFTSPFVVGEPNKGTTAVMQMGSSHTFFRRYLYLLALDLVESDEINANAGKPDESKPVIPANATPIIPAIKPKSAPATPAQREEIKKELTNSNGKADELQLKQLKDALLKLVAKDPSFKDDAKKMEEDTKGFTECSKQYAEKMLVTISTMLES